MYVAQFVSCVALLKKYDCIGAIDDTHVQPSVSKDMELSFRGRKAHCTQNVMAAIDLIFGLHMFWRVGRGLHMMLLC